MNLNLNIPINLTGYGLASTNILSSLIKVGANVSLFPIGQHIEADYKHHNNIKLAINNAQEFDYNAPTVRIFHQFSMAESIGKGKRIGYPFFELDKFNSLEKHHLSSLDTILSASSWAASIIKNEIGVDSPVVPLGVDTEIFKPSEFVQNNTTVFISVGKFEKRKHEPILEAFNLAFKDNDNVALWMMCDNIVKPDENIIWEKKYKSSPLANKIQFIHRQSSHEGVYNVMKYAHFGLFPSKAEGWNLEALEMMAIGRYNIITNYSAHTEFCTDENSYLIDGDGLEPANDGIWFHGQGNWLKTGPDFIQRLSKIMRECYIKHQDKEDIFNYEGVKTANKFTWDNTARELLKYM